MIKYWINNESNKWGGRELDSGLATFMQPAERKDNVTNEALESQGVETVWVNPNIEERSFNFPFLFRVDTGQDVNTKIQSLHDGFMGLGLFAFAVGHSNDTTITQKYVIYKTAKVTILSDTHIKYEATFIEPNPANTSIIPNPDL